MLGFVQQQIVLCLHDKWVHPPAREMFEGGQAGFSHLLITKI
jgi:hypothetical protein